MVNGWVRLLRLSVGLACVAFVDGSELEPEVGVSVVLSEVGERRCVVTHDGRVVLLKDVSFGESSKVLESLELLCELVKACFHEEKFGEISRNY